MLLKLSSDLTSDDFINPPTPCMTFCLDQAMRSALLKEMPTLDDMDVIVEQVGDMSRGVQICDTDVASGQGGADATLCFGKGKEKEVPTGSASKARSQSLSSDARASTGQSAPLL
jgi:hypothetical protein